MVIRSAVLEGTIPTHLKEEFDRKLIEIVLPQVQRYPKQRGVKIRYPLELEPGSPIIYCIFDTSYDNMQDMHAAQQGYPRSEIKIIIAEALKDFQGRVYHLMMEEKSYN